MRDAPLPPLAAAATAAASPDGRCRFVLADLTAETSFPGGCFDGAVDKGTLDCLDCLGLAAAAAAEVHRLVRPGGLLVSVSCRCGYEAHKRAYCPGAGCCAPGGGVASRGSRLR